MYVYTQYTKSINLPQSAITKLDIDLKLGFSRLKSIHQRINIACRTTAKNIHHSNDSLRPQKLFKSISVHFQCLFLVHNYFVL